MLMLISELVPCVNPELRFHSLQNLYINEQRIGVRKAVTRAGHDMSVN